MKEQQALEAIIKNSADFVQNADADARMSLALNYHTAILLLTLGIGRMEELHKLEHLGEPCRDTECPTRRLIDGGRAFVNEISGGKWQW